MTDLTAITTPFGLLDDATREALKAHGGPYEYLSARGEWAATSKCDDGPGYVHRVKPQPPKPREWWLRIDAVGGVCGSDPVLGDPPPNWDPGRTIRVREVLE